jgi:hypothetical protein
VELSSREVHPDARGYALDFQDVRLVSLLVPLIVHLHYLDGHFIRVQFKPPEGFLDDRSPRRGASPDSRWSRGIPPRQ